jgi:excinuclease UvrABC ATPase subunit
MRKKLNHLFFGILLLIFACQSNKNSEEPDLYEASPMAAMMRDMVEWSKDAKSKLSDSISIKVPDAFFELKNQAGTRDEHQDKNFQALAEMYVSHLKKINEGENQVYYYNQSIQACKSCHNNFCGGPLVVIEQLSLD